MDDLIADLRAVINKHSAENGSDTPDFILAEYLAGCLTQFNRAVRARQEWYTSSTVPQQATSGA